MTKEQETLKNRAFKAAERYFSTLAEPLAEKLGEANGFIVYLTDEGYIFVNVTYNKDNWKRSYIPILREEFEIAMVEFFAKNLDAPNNKSVRCDEIQLRILGDDKALIRHVVNAVNED